MITQKWLQTIFFYNPMTGVFTRRLKTNTKQKLGEVAGRLNADGYWHIHIGHTMYKAHRLVYLYLYGELPLREVDHINGNKSDNRLANLRLCERKENCRNFKKYKNNTSGFVGVSKHKKCNRWVATMQVDGTQKYLGLFKTPEEASAVYEKATKEVFGEFHRSLGVDK